VFRGEYNNITMMIFGDLLPPDSDKVVQKLFDELPLAEVEACTPSTLPLDR
jgi:hypothetical protein